MHCVQQKFLVYLVNLTQLLLCNVVCHEPPLQKQNKKKIHHVNVIGQRINSTILRLAWYLNLYLRLIEISVFSTSSVLLYCFFLCTPHPKTKPCFFFLFYSIFSTPSVLPFSFSISISQQHHQSMFSLYIIFFSCTFFSPNEKKTSINVRRQNKYHCVTLP